MTEIPDPASCVGNCDECAQPEACKDARICLEHSGNTTKINSLMERTATLELKDDQVDKLTGRVNLLINICLIVIAGIAGNFTYSFTVNKMFETKYTEDRLALKDTLHNMDSKFSDRMNALSNTVQDDIRVLSKVVEVRFDDASKDADVRFNSLEKGTEILSNDLERLRIRAKERDATIIKEKDDALKDYRIPRN